MIRRRWIDEKSLLALAAMFGNWFIYSSPISFLFVRNLSQEENEEMKQSCMDGTGADKYKEIIGRSWF